MITARERRLEIIARVSAKMAAERRARGDEVAAVRMEEFFSRIAAIVRGDAAPSPTLGWVNAGLEPSKPPPKPARERPEARNFHEPRGGDLWD